MDLGYAKGLARSALGGATFEFGDELEAMLRALPPGSPTYNALVQQIRAEQGRFEEANPGAALAANLGGALVGGGAGMAARAGRALAARAAARPGLYGALAGGLSGAGAGGDVRAPADYTAIPDLPANADTQTKLLAGALNAYNSVGRGLRGAGMSEGAIDRALGSMIGAPLGAAAGKLLPPAMAAALRRKKLLALGAATSASAAGSEPQRYAGGGAVQAPTITIGG